MIRPVVVKYGGSLLEDARRRARFLSRVAGLSRRRVPVVLVHGGGKAITRAMAERGLTARFVRGLRVTSPRALGVVQDTLFRINQGLAATLTRAGAPAVGVSGREAGLLEAAPLGRRYGRVGRVTRVRPRLLRDLLRRGIIPVIASVAGDGRGGALNVNADEAASAVAVALRAGRLVLLTDVAGVLDGAGRAIPRVRIGEVDRLVRSGRVIGGMVPKLRACAAAVRRGVGEVDIVDGRSAEAVSAAIAGRRIRGTRIAP